MYEDLYPHEGDYDFNDVVVNFRLVANASNQIVEAKVKLIKMARGEAPVGHGQQLARPSAKVASRASSLRLWLPPWVPPAQSTGSIYANIIFWDKISEAQPNALMQHRPFQPAPAADTTDGSPLSPSMLH